MCLHSESSAFVSMFSLNPSLDGSNKSMKCSIVPSHLIDCLFVGHAYSSWTPSPAAEDHQWCRCSKSNYLLLFQVLDYFLHLCVNSEHTFSLVLLYPALSNKCRQLTTVSYETNAVVLKGEFGSSESRVLHWTAFKSHWRRLYARKSHLFKSIPRARCWHTNGNLPPNQANLMHVSRLVKFTWVTYLKGWNLQ